LIAVCPAALGLCHAHLSRSRKGKRSPEDLSPAVSKITVGTGDL
jgi:hypothetical protein